MRCGHVKAPWHCLGSPRLGRATTHGMPDRECLCCQRLRRLRKAVSPRMTAVLKLGTPAKCYAVSSPPRICSAQSTHHRVKPCAVCRRPRWTGWARKTVPGTASAQIAAKLGHRLLTQVPLTDDERILEIASIWPRTDAQAPKGSVSDLQQRSSRLFALSLMVSSDVPPVTRTWFWCPSVRRL